MPVMLEIIRYSRMLFQFDQEEPKEVVKEKPKVGKLNLGAFGGAAATEEPKPAPKRSWKKKEKKPAENGEK